MPSGHTWATELLASVAIPGDDFNVADDINIEADLSAWDKDTNQCNTLALWRWAETAYGR